MIFNSTTKNLCGGKSTGSFSIILLFMVTPFHLLIIKILASNLRLSSPRHVILLCLSISDCLQIIVDAVCLIVLKIVNTTTMSTTCKAFGHAIVFNTGLTFVVSSFSLVALSIDRYITLCYSLRRHVLLTNYRAKIGAAALWAIGLIAGTTATAFEQHGQSSVILTNSPLLGKFIVGTTILVSVVLIFVQVRLIVLSRRNLRRVLPGETLQRKPAQRYGFRRQLRIAFVASIIFVSYLICMVPASFVIIATEFVGLWKPTHRIQMFVISLGMINTILNPFIYGIGMADTRQQIKRDLNKLKQSILEKLHI